VRWKGQGEIRSEVVIIQCIIPGVKGLKEA
jgi:hypothetical protein